MTMIHEITAGAIKNRKRLRVGRGESSGHGKTCGRGTKGSGARVGKPIKRGHEGGQTPIYRRMPKRGFSNENFERRFHVVNLGELNRFDDGATVDATALIEAGLVPDRQWPVKILGEGELTRKLTVVAGWYSKSAHEKITAAGGVAQNLKGEAFAFPKPKKRFVKQVQPAGGGKKAKGAPEAKEGEKAPEKAEAKAEIKEAKKEAPAAPAPEAPKAE
jgi:large subunit ribosomal protein L15